MVEYLDQLVDLSTLDGILRVKDTYVRERCCVIEMLLSIEDKSNISYAFITKDASRIKDTCPRRTCCALSCVNRTIIVGSALGHVRHVIIIVSTSSHLGHTIAVESALDRVDYAIAWIVFRVMLPRYCYKEHFRSCRPC